MTPNIWPPHPSCAAFEPAFKAIGRLVNDVALLLASHCDALVTRKLGPTHPFTSLHATLCASTSAKARLLNYYPSPHPAPDALWCGYHNDHSILTALIPQQFYHADTRVPLPVAPDGRAGLYTHSEGTDPRKADIPPGAIAFQIGEAAQIMSGGVLRATPHAVRMPKGHAPHLARLAFAVFLQPNPWDMLEMPSAYSDEQVRRAVCTSPLVPSLQDGRWQKGDRFVDFAAKTIKAYQA